MFNKSAYHIQYWVAATDTGPGGLNEILSYQIEGREKPLRG